MPDWTLNAWLFGCGLVAGFGGGYKYAEWMLNG